MHTRNRTPRRGFTLIELLVVISILAVLAGLTVGVIGSIRRSTMKSATETRISAVASGFDQQWKAVIDNAKDDDKNNQQGIPSAVKSIAGDDSRRALVIWTKVKLKWEFPQNFTEALTGVRGADGTQYLPPQPMYVRELNAAGVTQLTQCAAPTDTENLMKESAVCLRLALQKSRRGMSFNAGEAVGASGTGTITITGADGTSRDFQAFIDSWGQPIVLIRWPFGAGYASDNNQPPFRQLSNRNEVIDPQDPERTLQSPAWWAMNNGQNVKAFVNALIHPLQAPPQDPFNLSPVILSGGPDKSFGTSSPMIPAHPGGDWGIDPFMTPTGPNADDNLASYRTRAVGKKGD